jgi:hypothetical protein
VWMSRVAVVESNSNSSLLGFWCNDGVELCRSTSRLTKPLEWHVGVGSACQIGCAPEQCAGVVRPSEAWRGSEPATKKMVQG